jgi:hypothetical protein
LALQADDKILAAGDFDKYNSVDVPGLVRLNSDGSIDGIFANRGPYTSLKMVQWTQRFTAIIKPPTTMAP